MDDTIEEIVVRPSTRNMIWGLLLHMFLPVVFTTLILGTPVEKGVFLGLDLFHLFMIPMDVFFIWLLYRFLAHIWVLDRCSNRFLVFDKQGVLIGNTGEKIGWDRVESWNVMSGLGDAFPDYVYFYLEYRPKKTAGESAGCPKTISYRCWLNGTDANEDLIKTQARRWHSEAKARLAAAV